LPTTDVVTQAKTTGQSRNIDASTNATAISHQRDPLNVAIRANSSAKTIQAKNPVFDPEWRMPQYLPPRSTLHTKQTDKIKTPTAPEM
jgi:hypothetical protein